ncbi:sn-glycerol-3-phosphate ABC transporter ATP-binding protein UgpC [bacterium]|nr:sn-glycerol-3-phosphate ABC transporter ATP-binding protein UgpC [bacterium]
MANVKIKNLSKNFDKKNILNDINLEINNEEFCVLVGPSGCGKSTLLRIIAGLENEDCGEIYFDDKKVNQIQPKDRDIAFVFQSYALYPHLSVYENIAFSLKIKGYKKEIIDKKVKEVAEILGLSDLLKRKPKELSGGQRQRVALGRAIVREPKIFLMDEPLSNLDAKLRASMRSEIKKLQRKLKTTCIYVTHDQVEAMTMGDRVVVLEGGKIQQNDTPEMIYKYPQNTFTATFMGGFGMNIVKVSSADGEYFYSDKKMELVGSVDFPQEKEFLMGFRADDISTFEISNSVKMSVDVDFVESLGSYKLIYFNLEGKKHQIKVSSDFEVKEKIDFFVEKSKLHFFNSTTNKRI